jgi:hypothetical protein
MSRIAIFTVLMIFGTAPATVYADDDRHKDSNHFSAKLSGYNEVHFSGGPPEATLAGAISTGAEGKFRAVFDEKKNVIHYELSYERLRGDVTQGHIHFGQRHTTGGIVVWLCETTARPAPPEVAAQTPDCPAQGTVEGMITPGQVLPQPTQGFEKEFGDLDALLRAIRAGAAYVNVHSSVFGPGEIRGQIRDGHKRRHKDGDKDHDKGDHQH